MVEYLRRIYDGFYEGYIWRSICEGYMADYMKDIWKIYGGAGVYGLPE